MRLGAHAPAPLVSAAAVAAPSSIATTRVTARVAPEISCGSGAA